MLGCIGRSDPWRIETSERQITVYLKEGWVCRMEMLVGVHLYYGPQGPLTQGAVPGNVEALPRRLCMWVDVAGSGLDGSPNVWIGKDKRGTWW